MNIEKYHFAMNINGTGKTGIVNVIDRPPTITCWCNEGQADIILKALNLQLPTDEEIDAHVNSQFDPSALSTDEEFGYERGIKWLRDKIQSQLK